MKLNAAFILSLALVSTACSKGSNVNTTQVGGSEPIVETQAQIQQRSRCELAEKVLAQPSAGKLKGGLDEIVAELTDEDTKTMTEAARVWRRASPSALFPEAYVPKVMANGVETLNSIGVRMVLHGLVRNAPTLKLHAGSFYSHVAGFPSPKAGSTDKSTMREMYLDIPAYGITYGESFADSGLGIFGQLYTDVGTDKFTVTMVYSAAASKYGIRIVQDGDLKNGPIKSEDCTGFPTMSTVAKLPIVQTTLRECEFGGCKNIPKD